MKKLFLITVVLFLACASSALAQTNKGRVLMGVYTRTTLRFFDINECSPDIMNIGFSTLKLKSDSENDYSDYEIKYSNFNLSPRVGYFVINNLAVGVDLNVGYLNAKDKEYDERTQMTLYTVGPFIRYYIPAGKVYPFIEAGAVFGSLNYKWTHPEGQYDSDSKTSIKSYGGGAGLAVPIGDRVMFDTMITYNSMTAKDKEDNPDNDRVVNGTFGVKFGFLVSLGK